METYNLAYEALIKLERAIDKAIAELEVLDIIESLKNKEV